MRSVTCMLVAGVALAQSVPVSLTDPITGRKLTWFKSPHNEVHHYYDISPWDPTGRKLLFFRFDSSVDKLTARGRYPGSLWVMNADGSIPARVADRVEGNYHTGANQFWGPGGKSVYFSQSSRTIEADLATGKKQNLETPVRANRIGPDFRTISCVEGKEWGVYDLATRQYKRLLTLDQARAMSPSQTELKDNPSSLQNTRFSPDGSRIIIVHRTNEDFPRVVEVFVYDFRSGIVKHVVGDLHHPTWRPDSKAILFVRRRASDNLQSLMEVDVASGRVERRTTSHMPGVHVSYHPKKPHLALVDCYGGPMGYGLATVDLRTGEMKQLVTIPLGSKPRPPADDRFEFRNWGLWIPQRPYLNEPRPVWSADGSKVLFTSEESGRINLYIVDTSDL